MPFGDCTGKIELAIKNKKTNITPFPNCQPPNDILIGQNKIEIVDDIYSSCGTQLTISDVDQEINCRIGTEKYQQSMLTKICKGNKFSLKTKIRFYNSNILVVWQWNMALEIQPEEMGYIQQEMPKENTRSQVERFCTQWQI